MDFVDTMGTLIGLSYRAKLLDEKGNLPEIEKPMLCDALATVAGAVLGMLMLKPILELDFNDMTKLAPAFLVIVLMSFTYNLGVGMTAGFIVYPIMKTVTGKFREIPSGIWVLSALSILYYVFGA